MEKMRFAQNHLRCTDVTPDYFIGKTKAIIKKKKA